VTPCLRPYDWDGGGDKREVAMKESSPSFHGRSAVKAEKFEGNREARQALALSVAGVIVAMFFWNLMMLLWY
jgi:hypothetical protein